MTRMSSTRAAGRAPGLALAGIALIACGTPPPRAPGSAAGSAGDLAAPAAPAGAALRDGAVAVVSAGTRRVRIEAPHAGAIELVAATADGGAAVSCDELGGVRLWPALDGSVEPRVVDLPRPAQLAIGRDPRGFVVAMLDEAGGLIVQVVDRDGLTVRRASLLAEPGYAGIAFAGDGVLAWRADQRVVRVTADGTPGAPLGSEPGHGIVAIAAAGARAIAILEAGAGRRARWLTLGGGLAWGAWIGGFHEVRSGDGRDGRARAAPEIGDQLALSPGGKWFATLSSDGRGGPGRLSVFDAVTGAARANEPVSGVLALEFADDEHLALGVVDDVVWYEVARPTAPRGAGSSFTGSVHAGLLAAGGGRAITAAGGDLVLATPTAMRFLGYELPAPAVAAIAPGGDLVIGLGDTLALLDRELAARPAPDLAVPAGSLVADLRWLAGTDWLVETTRAGDGLSALALVDTATRRRTPLRGNMSILQTLMYEPTTGLTTLSLGDDAQVFRHAPGRLDPVSRPPGRPGYERVELVPVAPALAGGAQLVVVRMRNQITVRWVHDPRALEAGAAITVDGSLAAVDRAGHAFVWQDDGHGVLELAIYAEGKRIGTLPTSGGRASTLWPDPGGTRVVVVGQGIALIGIDGVRRWAQPFEGVSEALWLDDGSLAVISAAGVARLDPATGRVLAARCGWGFGLAARRHAAPLRFEPVCTRLD